MTDFLLEYPVIAFYATLGLFVGALGWMGYIIAQTIRTHLEWRRQELKYGRRIR